MKFRQASNCCKGAFEAAKLAYADKTKDCVTSRKLGQGNFWEIAYCALSKGKSAVFSLFNGPEVFSSSSEKVKLFAGNFPKK